MMHPDILVSESYICIDGGVNVRCVIQIPLLHLQANLSRYNQKCAQSLLLFMGNRRDIVNGRAHYSFLPSLPRPTSSRPFAGDNA